MFKQFWLFFRTSCFVNVNKSINILKCVSVKNEELVIGAFDKVCNKRPSEIAQNKNKIKMSKFIFHNDNRKL
jgi:hypothetical protein